MFIALYNGNAGWADTAGKIGICHAEIDRVVGLAAGKVFVINIYQSDAEGSAAGLSEAGASSIRKKSDRI